MKKITFVLLVSFASTLLLAQAPSDKYIKIMEQKIAALDTTQDQDGLKEIAAAFVRIGDAEKTQWLPYYYAALSYIRSGYMYWKGNPDDLSAQIDPDADLAEKMLNKAIELSKETSETWVLKKMLLSLRMLGNVMSRFMTYGTQVEEAMKKAQAMDPSNPRVYLLQGMDKFNTPEQWGGSKEEAKVLLEKAKALYGTFKPETSIHPNWGLNQVAYFLSQYK